MSDNAACQTTHPQILSGICPWCDRRIEAGQPIAKTDDSAPIRWNWAAIEDCLRSGDQESRTQTVIGLGDLAAQLGYVLPLLAVALADVDAQVRELAESACGQIGSDISADQADWLELHRHVADRQLAVRLILLGKYFSDRDPAIRARRATHIYWLIEHHPDRKTAGNPEAYLLRFEQSVAYDPARSLWLQQCATHKSNAAVLGNAARFFVLNDPELAEKLFVEAQTLDPTNPEWHVLLAHLHQLSAKRGDPESRNSRAKQAMIELEMAEQLRSSHSGGLPAEFGELTPEQSRHLQSLTRLHTLPDRTKAAFEAGELNFARQFAEECLALASSEEIGEFFQADGNAIHYSHLVLGRIALREGHCELAKAHLLNSGRTKGSPNLGSFGPNMSLAKELLELGERDVVIEYLDLCSTFWESGSDTLVQWKEEIARGELPAFGANLVY